MKNIPYNEITLSSKTEDYSEIMSTISKEHSSCQQNIYLFINIYKELPVTNSGEIFKLNSSEILFKACSLQLAAIKNSMETILRAPFMNENVLAKVAYVDAKHGLVALNDFSYAEVHFTKRSLVRVRPKVPINVKLIVDNDKIAGVIRDISINGCRIATPAGCLFENASHIALLLKFICEGQFIELSVKAKLLRIANGPMYECVLIFEHTEATEKGLSLFIYQRQVEILRELKEFS